MAEEVKVIIDGLRQVGRETGGLGDKVESILNSVKSRSEALGKPWGNDSYGMQFEASHGPNVAEMFDGTGGNGGEPSGLPGLTKGFRDCSAAQVKSADVLQQREDRNTRPFEV